MKITFHSLSRLNTAIQFYRTLIMLRNARKQGLRAIVVGAGHASHVGKEYDVVIIDGSKTSEAAMNEERKCYADFKNVLPKLMAAHRRGMLFK